MPLNCKWLEVLEEAVWAFSDGSGAHSPAMMLPRSKSRSVTSFVVMMVVAAGGWNFDVEEHQMKLGTACFSRETLTSKQRSLGSRGTSSKWSVPTCLSSMIANNVVLDMSNLSSGTLVAAGCWRIWSSRL